MCSKWVRLKRGVLLVVILLKLIGMVVLLVAIGLLIEMEIVGGLRVKGLFGVSHKCEIGLQGGGWESSFHSWWGKIFTKWIFHVNTMGQWICGR